MKTIYQSVWIKYGFWLVSGLILYLLVKLSPGVASNAFFFTLLCFYLLLLPGWLLFGFLKVNLEDRIGRFLAYFALGLSFYFVLSFIAIFAGISLASLSIVIFILLAGLLITSLLLALCRNNQKPFYAVGFNRLENLYFILPVAIGAFILWVVYLKGANLNGDPYLHLSIIRKALDGTSLSSRDLALTKTQFINPAYVYPVWHIFLAFLSKISHLSIFQVWSNILILLTLISFLVWYYFSKVLFQKTSWTILALSLFMIFVFYGGPGYLFTRLGVPDTFSQLILLPLGLAFALKYILDHKPDKKILIINFLLAFILLVLHGPHYFYLVVSTSFFGILYAATHWQDQDYKPTLWKFLKVFLVELAALILIGATIELRSHALSVAIIEFYKSPSGGVIFSTSFQKFGLVYKYGFLLLPLVFLFWRSRRLLFIPATMLLVPLIYWTPLQSIFNKSAHDRSRAFRPKTHQTFCFIFKRVHLF